MKNQLSNRPRDTSNSSIEDTDEEIEQGKTGNKTKNNLIQQIKQSVN